jgi:hypothetical protein
MFALVNLNDIQTHMLRLVIHADTAGDAWNAIISKRPRSIGAIGGGSRELEYFLFELFNPVALDLFVNDTQNISFNLNNIVDDSGYSIRVKNCFKEYCLNTFSVVKYTWTNYEFVQHYHGLRDIFSNYNLTDDTPTMWNIHIVPIVYDKLHNNIGFSWNPKEERLTINTTDSTPSKRQNNSSWIITQESVKCDTLIDRFIYRGFVAV